MWFLSPSFYYFEQRFCQKKEHAKGFSPVWVLAQSQVSKNVVDNQGSTPLHESVKMGYLEVSKILLAKQVEKILLRIVDFHHFIGLLEMVIPKYVRFWWKTKLKKNVINTIGWMPLHWTSCSRHSEVCKNCTWKLSGKNSDVLLYILLHFWDI